MKKIYSLFLIFLPLAFSAQTTINFTLDSAGEDATVADWASSINNNYPNEIEYFSGAWTIYGDPVMWRNFFKFDLSCVPPNAIVISANLSLFYAAVNNFNNAEHSSQSNSNESVLQRITSPWAENTVTWNNQPTATTEYEVILPQSTKGTQDYININVTAMVQRMVSNPSMNFGFLLRLTSETYYARMIFASGDNPDAARHPSLQISYTALTSVNGIADENRLTFFPNPAANRLTLSAQPTINSIDIYDLYGQKVFSQSKTCGPNLQTIDVVQLKPGIYFMKVYGEEKQYTEKLIIEE